MRSFFIELLKAQTRFYYLNNYYLIKNHLLHTYPFRPVAFGQSGLLTHSYTISLVCRNELINKVCSGEESVCLVSFCLLRHPGFETEGIHTMSYMFFSLIAAYIFQDRQQLYRKHKLLHEKYNQLFAEQQDLISR